MSRPHVRVSVQSLKATSLEHLHHLSMRMTLVILVMMLMLADGNEDKEI